MTTPLAGITVLDFGQIYQGPYATLLMAKAGANVIKIEPLHGEPLRRRALAAGTGDTTLPMAMLNANKRAITRLERTALLKWASALVGALGIEALNVEPLGIEEPAPVVEDGDPTDLIDPAVPEESAVVPPPVDVETPTMSWDQTSDSAVPVGAGSNGKAHT